MKLDVSFVSSVGAPRDISQCESPSCDRNGNATSTDDTRQAPHDRSPASRASEVDPIPVENLNQGMASQTVLAVVSCLPPSAHVHDFAASSSDHKLGSCANAGRMRKEVDSKSEQRACSQHSVEWLDYVEASVQRHMAARDNELREYIEAEIEAEYLSESRKTPSQLTGPYHPSHDVGTLPGFIDEFESIVSDLQKLLASVEQLAAMVSRNHEPEETRYCNGELQRGFELTGKALNDFREKRNCANSFGHQIHSRMFCVTRAWKQLCKNKIHHRGRDVHILRVIAAKSKPSCNTYLWRQRVQQVRSKTGAIANLPIKGTTLHKKAKALQPCSDAEPRRAESSTSGQENRRKPKPTALLNATLRQTCCASKWLSSTRLSKGWFGFFCFDDLVCADGSVLRRNSLLAKLTAARQCWTQTVENAVNFNSLLDFLRTRPNDKRTIASPETGAANDAAASPVPDTQALRKRRRSKGPA